MLKKYKLAFVFLGLSIPITGVANEDPVFSLNSWQTQGQTKWRHDASLLNSYYGVPTSELDYQGVSSTIAEINVSKYLSKGHQVSVSFGTGRINSGTLIDDDYLSASGATRFSTTQSGAHRFSRTHSDINGSGLFYIKGEFIPKEFMRKTDKLDMHASLGFHYWQEEYIAYGLRQVECTALSDPDLRCYPAGTVAFTGVKVITNKVEWTGMGIGLDAKYKATEMLRFNLAFTYYPFMDLVNEDIHHLRTTGSGALAQDPSIRMTGGGTGLDFTAGLKYQFEKNISAHLGYRLWQRRAENQTITFYGAGGGSSSAKLMDFTTRREGVLAGITFVY